MAVGDDALAAGIELTPGTAPASDIDLWINKLADEVARRTMATLTVARGGTGATNAASARSNLGIPTLGAPDQAAPGQLPVYNGNGQLTTVDPTAGGHAASKQYVDNGAGARAEDAWNRANNAQGTANGKRNYDDGYFPGDLNAKNIYLRESFGASSSWTVAYINGDGRVSKGTSSLRYKDLLSDPDVTALGDIWPALRQYAMKGGDGKPTLGHIAEEVAANPDTQRFAVYQTAENEHGEWVATDVVDSIDFIQLLLAQTAQLNARVAALEEAA